MLEVRLTKDVSQGLRRELGTWRSSREPVAFGLASSAVVPGKDLVLIRDIIVPPESAYLPSAGHGARWSGAYNIELLNLALEKRQGVFIFHCHPERGQVAMSGDDHQSALALLPKFQVVQPKRPHGSIVIGPDSAAGMIILPQSSNPVHRFRLRWIEESVRTWPLPASTPNDRILFERQPIASTALTKTILREGVVAVVGLSGGGSQTVPQLACLDIGEIVGVDSQRFDHSNRLSTDAITWLDLLFKQRKTSAMRRKVWWASTNTRFKSVNDPVPHARALEELKRADIIVGCINNLHGRADLMEVAWRYCIPYVDIGLTVQPERDGKLDPPPIKAIAGNIFTAIPGGPCMWCTDFLTQQKLDAETDGRGRAYLQERSTNGVKERDAHVAAFNGVLASQAANEVLRLFLGLTPQGGPAFYRRYDGFSGTMAEWRVSRNPSCAFCRDTLAAGDPIWN